MDHTASSSTIALVAEDEVLVRMVAADMLEDAGFRVIEVGDAQAALDYLVDSSDVTLLFTDIDMPGRMDGIGLAQEVARCWPHIAIMVCSGRVKPPAGALPTRAHFISKPYSNALVQQVLAEKGLP
jgi:CheY-like chemotaxis protein